MRTSMATMNSHSIEKNGRVAILFIIVFAILLDKAASRRCEHSLKSETGYFGRGDFIDRYQNAAKCTWKIETSSGSRIKLILRLFDDNCTVNYIAVYDGPSTEDKLLGKFCGKHTSPVIITTTNKMFMLSHSDTSPGNGGFQAFYSTECNHLLNTTDGNMTSPNYPNPYPDAQLCTYQLQTTPGKRIKLYFDDFNLESDNSCWFDFVSIYDTLLGKYCGDSQLSPLVSTSHRMLMVFHADASRTGTGFRAHYSSEPVSNCSHMVISSSLSDVEGNNEDYTEQTSPGI